MAAFQPGLLLISQFPVLQHLGSQGLHLGHLPLQSADPMSMRALLVHPTQRALCPLQHSARLAPCTLPPAGSQRGRGVGWPCRLLGSAGRGGGGGEVQCVQT